MQYFNQVKVKLHHVSPLLVELLCNSPEMHAGSSSTQLHKNLICFNLVFNFWVPFRLGGLYCFHFHFSYNIKSKKYK